MQRRWEAILLVVVVVDENDEINKAGNITKTHGSTVFFLSPVSRGGEKLL